MYIHVKSHNTRREFMAAVEVALTSEIIKYGPAIGLPKYVN